MELLYVWIEDYKNIKKQGFNFSPKHWFNFKYVEDENKKVTGGTLKYEKRNNNYPEKFFEENISNVSAIVGKNGSGKSSLMEALLKFTLGSGTETIKENDPIVYRKPGAYKAIFVYLENDKLTCFQNLPEDKLQYSPANIIKEKTLDDYLKNTEKHSREYANKRVNFFKECLNITPCYFSNIFREEVVIAEKQDPERIIYPNEKNNTYESNPRFDISTNKLLAPFSTDKIGQNWGVINFYYWGELKKIVTFVARFSNDWNEHKSDRITFQLPKYLKIENRWTTLNISKKIQEEYNISENIITGLNNSKFQGLSQSTQHKLFIWKTWLENYQFDIDDSNLDENFNIVRKILNDTLASVSIESSNHALSMTINDAFTIFTRAILDENIDVKSQHYWFPTSKIFLEQTALFVEKYSQYFNLQIQSFDISTDSSIIYKLIEEYSAIDYLDLFTFAFSFEQELNYPVFSSGEKYFLSLMGRLNSVYTELDQTSSQNILLLLDEAELTMHPEWQRKFISEITSSCSKIFKEHQIQFIITSHSPFIVSDLPKENIIFLDKEKETGLCKVCKPEDMSHTFGANIHSLYRNSFFLENGLMGEFAKGKIDGVIKDLIDKRKTPKSILKKQNEYQFIIDQVGEPLLKNRLQKLLNDKLNQNKSKEELREYYQERLLELDQ